MRIFQKCRTASIGRMLRDRLRVIAQRFFADRAPFYVDDFDGPLTLGKGIELQPVYDPSLRVFSVLLRRERVPAGVHGPSPYADHATETIGQFLRECGVRQLTKGEEFRLHGALLKAKPAPDFAIFCHTYGIEER
ncbi:hypothetical protein [Streptomyces nanshensis]|uniref:hypothetical protein n=1 Tax=Streptomyces nanshensis TaxID=518642 RepID=UPI00085C17CA|nr:hypothetical protein [Streptomyces nanshensis]